MVAAAETGNMVAAALRQIQTGTVGSSSFEGTVEWVVGRAANAAYDARVVLGVGCRGSRELSMSCR